MRLHLVFVLATALAPATVLCQSAPLPDLSRFSVGDGWEWRQVDNRTRLEEGRYTRTIAEKGGQLEIHTSDGWQRPLAFVFIGETGQVPWRQWPLEIGKRWSHNTTLVRADGVKISNRQDAEVVGYEEVVVPAGRFMAFKIEYDGFLSMSSGFNGRMTDTYWYAPEARTDVKHMRKVGQTNFTRELLSYPKSPP